MITTYEFLAVAGKGFCCGFFVGMLAFAIRMFRISLKAAVSGSGGLF